MARSRYRKKWNIELGAEHLRRINARFKVSLLLRKPINRMTTRRRAIIFYCSILTLLVSSDVHCLATNSGLNSDIDKGLLLLHRRHPDQALPLFNRVLNVDSKNQKAKLAKAETLWMLKRREDALALVEEVLKVEPKNLDALNLSSRIKFEKHMFAEAERDATLAIKSAPGDGRGYLARAAIYYQAGNFKKAIEEANIATRVSPQNSDVWRESAIMLRDKRGGGITHREFNYAISTAPNDTRNYDEHAKFSLERKRYDRIMPLCEKALKIDPKDGFALLNIAQLWLSKSNHPKALASVEAAEKAIPWSGLPHRLKGDIYAATLDDDESLAEYSKAIAKEPTNSDFYVSRGIARMGKRLYEDSVADFTRARQLSPYDSFALSLRADAYQALGKLHESLSDLSSVLKASPTSYGVFVRRGILYIHMNMLKEAESDFTKAIALKPISMHYERRGALYNQLKQYDKARIDFTDSLKMDRTNRRAQLGLATAYEGLGRKDLAEKCRSAAVSEIEGMLDQYTRAADGFHRLKHSLGK